MMCRTRFLLAPMLGLLLAACEPEQNAMTLTAECGGEQSDAAISACTTLLSSDAIEDLSESIKLAPEMASTFVLRGTVRQAKGDAAQAIGDYNQALRLDPNSADAYIRRGTAFGATHQFERAIQDFDIALKAQPGDSGILANRGSVLVLAGQYAKAIPDLDARLATFDRASRVQRNLQAQGPKHRVWPFKAEHFEGGTV